MLSAFSFGKIIKTFLPGIILLMALVLLADIAYQMLFIEAKTNLITGIIQHTNLATVVSIVVPLSILLGIFLNTVLWPTVIDNLREKWRCKEDRCVRDCFDHLKSLANQNIMELSKDKNVMSSLQKFPVTLRYYYLPIIKLENLNYIWESYFSWFEFQINILFALLFLLVSVITAGTFYIVKYDLIESLHKLSLIILATLILFIFALTAYYLVKSAQKNIWRFDEGLVCLIAGSLKFKNGVK